MDSMNHEKRSSYSQFACIGTGFSAICLGATLQRWYGIDDIQFFERYSELGGTWLTNTYPGCACDVPSVLYSYSFEPNPEWTRVLPSHDELLRYLDNVAVKYNLRRKMSFGVNVESCEWIDDMKRWRLNIRHINSDNIFTHECRFLFAGTGQLVQPKKIDVKGADSFQGPIFHSSKWRHDVDISGKKVVVFGNGCTAAQIVPAIVKKTQHLTQIVRSKHWILPAIDEVYTDKVRTVFNYIPGSMFLQRLIVFLAAENELRGFPMTKSAARFRQTRRVAAEKYMRSKAPSKYHDILIPDFEVGCKRRIYDSGYLDCLSSDNLTLLNERAVEIVPKGVKMENGFVEADVIVLANGYVTNRFLGDIKVKGKHHTLNEHWDSFGGAEAYNCSAMTGFPNFFILLGPNAATGHTSAIMAAENSVNFALRMIKPVLYQEMGTVEIKQDAEKSYVDRIQKDLSNTVWTSGCQSWYVEGNEKTGQTWNAMSYPYSQGHFWYRSLFPTWSDWRISMGVKNPGLLNIKHIFNVLLIVGGVLTSLALYVWKTNSTEYLMPWWSRLKNYSLCMLDSLFQFM